MTKLSDRLEALAEKATKGPWEADYGGYLAVEGGPIIAEVNPSGWLDDDAGGANAAIIAELVNNLPTILQALKDKDL